MAQDRFRLSNMTSRQKITMAVIALILSVLIWQLKGLFSDQATTSASPTSTSPSPATQSVLTQTGQPQQAPQPLQQVVQASMPKPVISQRELELLQQQQQIEAKYVAALNELQMLRLEREIAETNKAIIDAKLGTVTAQKTIVDLLAPPPPPQVAPGGYAQSLANNSGAVRQVPAGAIPPPPEEVSYTVVSISELNSRWNAVLGFQNNLYHVSIGDVLPADGSTVISINRSGVVLQKDGMRKKISLVPII